MGHPQLDAQERDDLAELERRVLDSDELMLKLEWPSIREGRTVAALTHHAEGALVAYLGVYSFGGPPDVELTGMVHPDHRRWGIMARLLDEALAICAQDGLTHRLLVVPRPSAAGAGLARSRGGELEHSEHSMVLRGAPRLGRREDPAVTLRPASEVDQPDLIRILTAGFGPPPPGLLGHLHSATAATLMVDYDGVAVGTVRTALDGGRGAIMGFAIDPEYRGRGIGADVLARACEELREQGADRVELQVEVENDNALHLYTSTGFAPVSTEDYYRLAG